MIEDILKNKSFRRFFPPVVGIVLFGLFVALGMWQLDRAAQKKASLEQFADSLVTSGLLTTDRIQKVQATDANDLASNQTHTAAAVPLLCRRREDS